MRAIFCLSSLDILKKLIEDGADITAYDPEAMDNIKSILGDKIKYAKRSMEALEGAEALLICTEWAAFRNPNFDLMKRAMASPTIFDGRNLYETSKMETHGFTYHSIGRKPVNA